MASECAATTLLGARSFSSVDFSDPAKAYSKKSVVELIRSYCVFVLCSVRPLVSNADWLLPFSRRYLGGPLVDFVVKSTFFAHFCGGERVSELKPCIEMLNKNGINAILDYDAENAPDDSPAEQGSMENNSGNNAGG